MLAETTVPLRELFQTSGATVFREASCATESVGRLQARPGAAMVLSMAQWLVNGPHWELSQDDS